MQKYFILLALSLIGSLAFAQPGKPSVKHLVTVDKVPAAKAIGNAILVVASDSSFSIGENFPFVSGELVQTANCKDGVANWMQHGKARLIDDTLMIGLYRADRDYVNVLLIKIWNGEFLTEYQVLARHALSQVLVLPTDQVLVLEKLNYHSGETITGFVNFRGTRWEPKTPDQPWEAKMDWVESKYVVRGAFRITID